MQSIEFSHVEYYHAHHLNRHADLARKAVTDAGIDLTRLPKNFHYIGSASLQNEKLEIEAAAAPQVAPTSRPVRPRRRKITVRVIQQIVADHFGHSAADIAGRGQHQPLARNRQIAMYLTRKLLKYPIQKIGRQFGGRDHSTVHHACRKIAALCLLSGETATHVSQIEAEIAAFIAPQVAS